jgi:small subunit ribosomal protein S6
MNNYEMTVVVSANVEDEVRAGVVGQVKDLIARFGGNISNVEEAGKKRLAYEIQHEKDGFYYFIKFSADATSPVEIENRVRIMDNVLRFLIVREEA